MRITEQVEKPAYSTPSVTSLKESEILEEIGPAQAYTGNFPFGF